jgi:hypothetical protein
MASVIAGISLPGCVLKINKNLNLCYITYPNQLCTNVGKYFFIRILFFKKRLLSNGYRGFLSGGKAAGD